ncbi:hypothetical protein DICPUDRAFT_154911 [Dictyostelium purpureum]|uniref:Uncharacterized protein n=1 Tax=Dictyostelium purpureum TaxID=5786 RepID=F0ZSK6_DICPU|nr:uncharacterized protein DICPUDRAFT_154911 [Dictyostelium purpureum]EGC33087.1 hypothetical protein DICPUDRAFT_154911 [Dictyostelium purpureum]|eukprot:XP_003290400.1 hypothetical protein DICPUDRAFT_154911 [Dictyostelium purpureum]
MPFNTPTGSAVVDIMNERILINYIKIWSNNSNHEILLLYYNISKLISNTIIKSQSRRNSNSFKVFQSRVNQIKQNSNQLQVHVKIQKPSNSSDASEDSSKGSSDSRSSSASTSSAIGSSSANTQEDLQSKNHNIKSEIIILQDKFSKESFNIGHDTLVGISEVSPSSHTDRRDRSINIGFSKKLIKSMKSNVGSSNAGVNGSPIILLNTSEEINGDRIKEIEHESESYRIAKKNLAMEKDLETNLLPLKFSTLKESLLRDLKNRYNIATNERRKRKEKEKKKEKGGEKEREKHRDRDRDRDRNRDKDRERSRSKDRKKKEKDQFQKKKIKKDK